MYIRIIIIIMRNKLQPNERKAIMLGYSRERVGYRLYDIECGITVEERNACLMKYKRETNI